MSTAGEQMRNNFSFHPANDFTKPDHQAARNLFKDLLLILDSLLPEGRHKSLAFTSLQESLMWSNAAIAIDGANSSPPSDE